MHDADSEQFEPDCVACHADKLDEPSLAPGIPSFHVRKLAMPAIPGDTPNEKCGFCHPNVDLSPARSAASLRRNVDVTSCAGCHAAGGLGFYVGP